MERHRKTGNVTRYFRLDLPPPKGPGYTQNVAYDTFFDEECGRQKYLGPVYAYNAYPVAHFKPETGIAVVDVLDMWDFYRLIGYDHKQRVWANDPANARTNVP